jgi:hypothetical protein
VNDRTLTANFGPEEMDAKKSFVRKSFMDLQEGKSSVSKELKVETTSKPLEKQATFKPETEESSSTILY